MRERELPRVGVTCFRAGDREHYARFARVRLDVFSCELGWPLPDVPDPATGLFDPFDAQADLWMAETAHGEAVGIVRALRVIHGFPHRELFDRHLAASDLASRLPLVATINALAVIPPFRRKGCVGEDGITSTVSTQLLEAALDGLSRTGVRVVLATVLSAASARAFARAGFHLIDAPRRYGEFRLINVGMVLPPAGRDAWRRDGDVNLAASVEAYFCDCEADVAVGAPVAALFA